MPRIVVLNYQISSFEIASCHREGCKDIKRDTDTHAAIQYGPFDSLEEALSDYIDSDMEELGWGREHVKVFPCCK